MHIESEKLKDNVIKKIEDCMDSLNKAKEIASEFKVPSNFEKKQILSQLQTNISSVITKTKNAKESINSLISDFQKTENKNKTIIDKLFKTTTYSGMPRLASITVNGSNTQSNNKKQNSDNEKKSDKSSKSPDLWQQIGQGFDVAGTVISTWWKSIWNEENSEKKDVLLEEPNIKEGLKNLNNAIEQQKNDLKDNAKNFEKKLLEGDIDPHLKKWLEDAGKNFDLEKPEDVNKMINMLQRDADNLKNLIRRR